MTTAMPGKFVKAEGWLHETAAAQAGLDDFDDDYYLGGLRVLLEALDSDLKLDENGRHRVISLILGVLVSRLYSQKGWHENADCLGDDGLSRRVDTPNPSRSGACVSLQPDHVRAAGYAWDPGGPSQMRRKRWNSCLESRRGELWHDRMI